MHGQKLASLCLFVGNSLFIIHGAAHHAQILYLSIVSTSYERLQFCYYLAGRMPHDNLSHPRHGLHE